jgi:putative nucleotide binding protein
MEKSKKYEEYARILDYLPHGRLSRDKAAFRAEPTIQLIGEAYFTLLEAVAKEGTTFAPHERVYVGKDLREKIEHITGRISYDELTSNAKSELPIVIEEIVKAQEQRFMEFFNQAQAVTPRMHALELVPGIGKKYMWAIIEARERKPFQSFEDLKTRTDLPDPTKLLTKRIIEELTGETKYRFFTRTP